MELTGRASGDHSCSTPLTTINLDTETKPYTKPLKILKNNSTKTFGTIPTKPISTHKKSRKQNPTTNQIQSPHHHTHKTNSKHKFLPYYIGGENYTSIPIKPHSISKTEIKGKINAQIQVLVGSSNYNTIHQTYPINQINVAELQSRISKVVIFEVIYHKVIENIHL